MKYRVLRHYLDYDVNYFRNQYSIMPTLRQSQPQKKFSNVLSETLNFITATQTNLAQTCHGPCRNHGFKSSKLPRDIFVSWFASATFSRNREVSVKVSVMEIALDRTSTLCRHALP